MKKSNIVFIGATKFGLKCLKNILNLQNINLSGIVTSTKKFEISYSNKSVKNVTHVDFNTIAKTNDIPLLTFKKGCDGKKVLQLITSWKPSIIIVCGWYYKIPKSWLNIAPAYGLHASLLPNYSGGAPLVWAIINGEKKTGITFFKMDNGIDSGPIVAQKHEKIYPDDTINTLYKRIQKLGLDLITEYVPKIILGNHKLITQDESKRRIMKQRSPEDGLIDWSNDVNYIDRFVRAQTKPYPGAYCFLENSRLTIWKGSKIDMPLSKDCKYGELKIKSDNFVVACAKGYFILEKFSFKNMSFNKKNMHKLFNRQNIVLRTNKIDVKKI